MALKLFQGFCMALADSVPGVSGGTVAFILGFYEPFLNAVHSLFGKDSAARRAALLYLLKLGIGWGVGLIGSILLLARMFENNIYFLSSLFFGLTLASVPCIVKAEHRQILGKPQNWPFALLGLALVCGLTWFRAVSPSGGALDYTALGALQYGYLFLSGALAISAMVLPGISGSSLLLALPSIGIPSAISRLVAQAEAAGNHRRSEDVCGLLLFRMRKITADKNSQAGVTAFLVRSQWSESQEHHGIDQSPRRLVFARPLQRNDFAKTSFL